MPINTRARYIDIVADTGISYRQADHWVRAGYIHTHYLDPSLEPTGQGGSGHPRYIDDDEIAVLHTMARLVHAGFVPETAAQLARSRTRLTDAVVRAVERLQRPPYGNPAAAKQDQEAE